MKLADALEELCYQHVEREEPISQERLEWLIDTASRLNAELSEVGILIAALSVYGEDASLSAVVRHARSRVHLVEEALRGAPLPDVEVRA